MPCSDGGWRWEVDQAAVYESDLAQARFRINELTQMLCGVMQQIAGCNEIMRALPVPTLQWWKDHQKYDEWKRKNNIT